MTRRRIQNGGCEVSERGESFEEALATFSFYFHLFFTQPFFSLTLLLIPVWLVSLQRTSHQKIIQPLFSYRIDDKLLSGKLADGKSRLGQVVRYLNMRQDKQMAFARYNVGLLPPIAVVGCEQVPLSVRNS